MRPRSTSEATQDVMAKSGKPPDTQRGRWRKISRRPLPGEDAGADAEHQSKKRRRSVSPEVGAYSASPSSTPSKRQRSPGLQATLTSEAGPAPAPQSTSSDTPQARDRGRPTTSNTRWQVHGAQSRRNEVPFHRSARRRPRTTVSQSGEKTFTPPDAVQDSEVAQESLTTHRTDASPIEKNLAAKELSNTLRTNGGTKTPRVTTAANPNPDVVVIAEAEADPIDFGTLVPEPNEGATIRLQLPDDGSSCKTLMVGRDVQCEIKLEERGNDDVHGSLELILRFDRGHYKRIVRVNPVGSDNGTVTPGRAGPLQPRTILEEGRIVTFGVDGNVRYRYVLPQDPLPQPTCWATRLFTWDSKMEPNFGGSRSNSSVYLVRNRKSGNRHAMKVIYTVRFPFNPALSGMVRREREALSGLNHPHVLELQHFRRDNVHSRMIFIFPEMEGGNLFDFVVKNRMPPNQRRINNFAPRVAKDLLSGLGYIHSKDIVHRDLKPENVFLAETVSEGTQKYPKVVIGDFGIARLAGERRTEMYDGGSNHWLSPISFRDPTEAETDFQIDLWGVALIIWFMLAGLPKPWGQAGAPGDASETNRLRWGWLEELNITIECIDFLKGFLVDHPSRCRTIEDAGSHSWIKNGVTTNLNAERQGADYAAVVDLDVQSEEETQVRFDDEY